MPCRPGWPGTHMHPCASAPRVPVLKEQTHASPRCLWRCHPPGAHSNKFRLIHFSPHSPPANPSEILLYVQTTPRVSSHLTVSPKAPTSSAPITTAVTFASLVAVRNVVARVFKPCYPLAQNILGTPQIKQPPPRPTLPPVWPTPMPRTMA